MGKYLKLAIFCLLFVSFKVPPKADKVPSKTDKVSSMEDKILSKADKAPQKTDGFALVELFTSEGCSSCPPADALVASLPKTYPSGVFILSFHVDYWDRLGWKDPFSSADFTQRQKQYGEVFRLNSIYTPQVVINGRTEMVGSDKDRIRNAIEDQLAHTANPSIDATARSTDKKRVTVDYTLKDNSKGAFHAALVQLQASTAVKKGENAGLQLHHADIVRDLQSSTKNKGSLTLSLPAGVTKEDCMIVVFLQDNETLQVDGARVLDIH
jgi:hypothetical protein